MNSTKERIIKEIKENQEKLCGIFSPNDEFIKIYEKMKPISKEIPEFANTPKEIFEEFNYCFYDKSYCSAESITEQELQLQFAKNINAVVLINGYFSKEKSNIISKNLIVKGLAEKTKEDFFTIEQYFRNYFDVYENQLTALNSILTKDGAFIQIPKNAVIEEPICIFSIITEQDKPYFFNERILVIAEENAEATIFRKDFSKSENATVMVCITLLQQAANSKINHYQIYSNNLQNNNLQINNSQKTEQKFNTFTAYEFSLQENATLNNFSFYCTSAYLKSVENIKLLGKNATVNNNSFNFLKKANNIIDTKAHTFHQAEQTNSNHLVKAIASNDSHFIFDGKIFVEPEAQKTDAKQQSKIILLDDNSKADCNPHLEIYADDVSCSHGTAIGNLDDDLLFYLNSRGIGQNEAQKLLLVAFAGEIIEKISNPALKEFFTSNLEFEINN